MMHEARIKCFTNELINSAIGPLYPGSVITLIAETGAHPNAFLVDFLKNVEPENKSVYFSVDEPPDRLIRQAAHFWDDIDVALSNGTLAVFNLTMSRDEVPRDVRRRGWVINLASPWHPSEVINTYEYKFGRIARKNGQRLRVVFDSASSYAQLAGEKDTMFFFREFISLIRTMGDILLVKVYPEMQEKSFVRMMEAQSDVIIHLGRRKGKDTLLIKKSLNPDYLYIPYTYEIKGAEIMISPPKEVEGQPIGEAIAEA